MNEVQRQSYLKVMGIQTYFPKAILRGAKQSPLYEFPPELAVQKSTESSAARLLRAESPSRRPRQEEKRPATAGSDEPKRAAATATTAQTASSEGLLPEGGVAAATAQKRPSSRLQAAKVVNASTEEAQQTAPEVVNELRFKLRYFKINETLAVIDEVPHQKSEQLNTQDSSLLKAILAALKLETADVDFRSESFSWPLAENLSMINAPSEEARRALAGFIQMRQETDRFTNLLVFAAQVDSLLVKQVDGIDVRDFEVSNSAYFMTVTSSLHSMLAFPALKRDVWRQLQPLRRRLTESN